MSPKPSVWIPIFPVRLAAVLLTLVALSSACGPAAAGDAGLKTESPAQVTPQAEAATQPPTPVAPPTQPTPGTDTRLVRSEEMGFCFVMPEGFSHPTNVGQFDVVGPEDPSGPRPAVMWVVLADAQGQSVEAVADQEAASAGIEPARSMIQLANEQALVLDGMPGQDLVRKVYVEHQGNLYTLTFSPYHSGILAADAQMETLYDAVISSWTWASDDSQCSAGR